MNGPSSYNQSPDISSSDLAPTSDSTSEIPVYKPGVSPNGISPNGDGGGPSFKLHDYQVLYHSLFVRRKDLKEARKDYQANSTPTSRNLVHQQEHYIVSVGYYH